MSAHPLVPHSSDNTPGSRAAVAAAIATALATTGSGLCDGFRSPDEAVFLKDRPLSPELFGTDDAPSFESCALMGTAFWLGSRAEAIPLVEAVAQAWTARARGESETSDDDVHACLLTVWNVPATADVLVGAMGCSDLAADLFGGVVCDGMTGVGFDGNDNEAHQIWEDGVDAGVDPVRLARALRAATTEDTWESLSQAIEEDRPEVLQALDAGTPSVPSPPRPR